MNKKELDSFMRDIDLLIPVKDANSKRFLTDMRSSISSFISSNADADMETIISEFGNPKDIAMDYIESIDMDELLSRLAIARLVRRLMMTVLIILLVALSIFSYYQHRGYIDLKNSIVTKEETVIEDGGP